MITEFASLDDLFEAVPDEKAAITYFTAVRWKTGEFCPYYGHDAIYHFSDGKTHKCAQCHKRFSIKVGTIFENTKIELRKWLAAIWLITSHRKGIASAQLARDIKVTQKAAWFMLHRLRHAARTRSFNRPLRGIIEADETFIGGRKATSTRASVPTSARPVHRLGQARDEIATRVEPGSNVMTDDGGG